MGMEGHGSAVPLRSEIIFENEYNPLAIRLIHFLGNDTVDF
jgi:hypothetical protein